jgi:signal transduction histidine kinase/CheY-like chemotaxis protein/HPt (histidine-containing phosphotransfer) domain-containing protein
MQDGQFPEKPADEAVRRMPRLPSDVRHLLDKGRTRLSGYTHEYSRLLGPGEFANLRNLALIAVCVSMLLAAVLHGLQQLPERYAIPIELLGLVVAVFLVLSRHMLFSRSRLGIWQAVVMLACTSQALLWLAFLLHGVEPQAAPATQVSLLAMVLLLTPLIYRLFIFISVLVLMTVVSAWMAEQPLQQLLIVAVLLTMLVMGLVASVQLARKRQLELQEQELAKAMAQLKAELADEHERLRHAQQQRDEVERDLQGVRELADSANKAKTEFLATISHEIRTPLNGILPILEMLLDSRMNKEQQRYVRTAFSSSRHLLRIINDVLDFARAESGKLQLESIEFDLPELVDGVVDLMQGSAANKGLQLGASIAEDVPTSLRGDPIRLRQIFTNLLSNAIKFTDSGRVRLAVSLRRASRKEVELLFSVTDTGIGMSRDAARRIFKSFTQADASTTRKHGGTGLGLVICKRLVELMGGKIGVRSRLGEGSDFWFLLPMRRSMRDIPPAREDLSGVRLLSVIPNERKSREVSEYLVEWGVLEERATVATTHAKLQTSAMLGRTWAQELLLVDAWGIEQSLVPLLREVRSDPLLADMHVVVACDSPELAEQLHREFNIYFLSGGMHAAPLRRCLYRLFDVQADRSGQGKEADEAGFRDLNLDKELALYETDDSGFTADVACEQGDVLLVEDNPVNLEVTRRVLERLGVRTMVAHNGEEALQKLQKGIVQLVFMDCQMPVMDGYQATRRWRQIEGRSGLPHLPVIAMTANAMQGDREKCLDAGMDDYLAKPVSIADVRAMLQRWRPDSPVRAANLPPGDYAPGKASPQNLIDRQVVQELREVMEDGFEALVHTYLENAPKLLHDLNQAARERLVDALVLPAHSLKSSSANLGAMRLSELARRVEAAARDGRLEDALAAQEKVQQTFSATRDALEKLLAGA